LLAVFVLGAAALTGRLIMMASSEKGFGDISSDIVIKCGAKIGARSLTSPFVRVVIDLSSVRIEYAARRISIPFQSIVGIQLRSGLFLPEIRIIHSISSIPSRIVIYSARAKALCRGLETRMDASPHKPPS
jgi:hypothetical protein